MTATEFEYRKHYDSDGLTVERSGLHQATIQIDDADLGDHHIVLHEVAHVIARSLYGPDAPVHGDEFSRIETALLEVQALGGREYKRADGTYKKLRTP